MLPLEPVEGGGSFELDAFGGVTLVNIQIEFATEGLQDCGLLWSSPIC